jgi:hypothetical protein
MSLYRMSAVNLIVIVESIQKFITHDSNELNGFHLPSLLAVAAALGESQVVMSFDALSLTDARDSGVKFLLFLYCFSLRGKSSQVRVLWEDHRNDLFINSFGI